MPMGQKWTTGSDRTVKKALGYGILASFFFAFTFILNRSMNLGGGYWLWSACLRYLFMLPMLALLVWREHSWPEIRTEIRRRPRRWVLWSTVGFGLFYMPLTMASIYGESWFVAATWQLTIVAGVLLTPLFGRAVPVKNFLMSTVVLCGIFLLQVPNIRAGALDHIVMPLVLILIAAFSYPLGNRKMMILCELTTLQRVFGMTLCSMPFWLVLSVLAFLRAGLPSGGQVVQSLAVALFSGVIATILFFKATDLVKNNPRQLAVVEATQSGEVLFTLLGGILFLGDSVPDALGLCGILVVVVGMVGNSLVSAK